MSLAMFIVGFCIFSAYVYFLIWNIFYNSRKNKEENYPGYYARHGQVDDWIQEYGKRGGVPPAKKQKK